MVDPIFQMKMEKKQRTTFGDLRNRLTSNKITLFEKMGNSKIKIYADENIEDEIVLYLRSKKVNIKSAKELSYSTRDDDFQFKEAFRQRRFLLTYDRDFLDNSRYPFNQLFGVIILDNSKADLGLGFIMLVLEDHIIPSGHEIDKTKIIVHRDHVTIYSLDKTNKTVKQILELK